MTGALALQPTPEGTVALLPLRDIKPAPWNPRTITNREFDTLKASLASDPSFLWNRPVLVQASTGFAYAGNMRYRGGVKLAQESRWPLEYYLGSQPAIPARVNDVSDAKAKADSFKDNNAWGAYQSDEAAELLAALRADGQDIANLGFSERTLDELLSGLGAGVDHIGQAAALDLAQLDEGTDGLRGLTPEDKLAAFEASAIRQIVLHYQLPEYLKIQAILQRLQGVLGVDTNSDVVTAVLLDYAEAHP